MTAPTPERRVGEAEARIWCSSLEPAVRDLARDLLDERAAVTRLTAEVERLTKEKAEVTSMAWELVRLVQSVPVPHDPIVVASIRSRLAALALPTNAPEAKE